MDKREASSGRSVAVGPSGGINKELVEGTEAVAEHGIMASRGCGKRSFGVHSTHASR